MKFLSVALIGWLGCGSVGPPPQGDAQPGGGDGDDGLRSGTRLKLSWDDYGGARLASTVLLDSQRNEQCFPRAWSDGRTYCSPRTSLLVYGNAGCTQPLGLLQATSCGALPTYFHESDPTTCDTLPAKLYPKGVQSALTQYWEKTATGCSGPNDLGSAMLFTVGAEIPLSELVELTPTAVEGSTRITQRFYGGRDGSRVFSSQHDAELDVDCTMSADPDPAMGRCVPSSLGAVFEFGDMACTERRMESRAGCALPKFAIELAPSCVTTASASTFYRPGALAASSPLFHKTGATCAATTARPDTNYYAVQAAITLPQLARAPDTVADRRIQLIHYTSGAGQLRDPRLYDTLEQTECTPLTFGKVTRCLPADAPSIATGYFSDAACQTAISVVDVAAATGCPAPRTPKFARRTIAALPGTCENSVEVRTIGAAYATPIYLRSGVDCVAATTVGHTYYALGAVVPLTEFVTPTTSTDP